MTAPTTPGNPLVAIYFVASPLQYLAARQIAERFEPEARQILVYYKHGVAPVVRAEDWDAVAYMPWPRFEPLPGPFGRLRRLRKNLRDIADLIGNVDEIHLHSAVFDTEAINYFVRGLPRLTGAKTLRARILPDGIISIRRYPLTRLKQWAQCLRKLRRLITPELDYTCFSGDRIGSDAPFVDRIYTLPLIPHQYPPGKVAELPPLVERTPDMDIDNRRALVVGQPLSGVGLMSEAQVEAVGREIEAWLKAHGIEEVHYKPHPKDPRRELLRPSYEILDLDEPLESYMARHAYAHVLGVRSTVLFLAREIYGPETSIIAFGLERVRFKSAEERRDMLDLMHHLKIEVR
ncbi:MAG: polysialyltransferase family glycosyltransferase [Halothiobacillaceae bacterium]